MTAEEFLKKWEGISNDDRHATFFRFDTMYNFAEAYHESEVKKLNITCVSGSLHTRGLTKKMIEARNYVDYFMLTTNSIPTYDNVAEYLGIKKTATYYRLRGYREKMVQRNER